MTIFLWFLSILMCLGLVVGIIGIIFPETVLPILVKLWDRQTYYGK